eukprot:TRINITY_DN9309_c0_g1_i3.p1 TRINITY_DN9309_c0_g1~~TRINITY_DN9309_c0_g1_i3.p1  ORF type:complete len:200 (+),score=29.20 TRINITY_DN9309_c0_g1_i3:696-1295(+)
MLRRERLLARMLVQKRVRKVMTSILRTELKCPCKKVVGKKAKVKSGVFEMKTLAATAGAEENGGVRKFPRVESAGQMVLFESESSGPKCGQVSRGVMTDAGTGAIKKNIFYVHHNLNSEEEFKETINYNSPMLFKCKPKFNKPPDKTKGSASKLLKDILIACGSAFTFIGRKEDCAEDNHFFFNFHTYGSMIMTNAHQR